jgi:hypothetical protein
VRNGWEVFCGDCMDYLVDMPDSSIDSIVTDPPYGLKFMGAKWDAEVPHKTVWQECLRVLKPGGHLLAFAGTRTQHRMAVAIEDGGFEIRDMIAWVYGSGFPKSLDVSKAIGGKSASDGQWEGWGTALKPAMEPITVARKPLDGTVAKNVLRYGTGGINVDGCRVGKDVVSQHGRSDSKNRSMSGRNYAEGPGRSWTGRWPANLIHDGSEEVMDCFPEAPGQMADASSSDSQRAGQRVYGQMKRGSGGQKARGDSGSAARFFYCAKSSRRERGADNDHPTVKPLKLMRYLCRLVTPPGGMVLDPYCGSGTTGMAAVLEGFRFTGCELDARHAEVASRRIDSAIRKGGCCGR